MRLVVQHAPDRKSRIVKRRSPTGRKDYIVERLVLGVWTCSPNGPWDFLSNARRDLRGEIGPVPLAK